MSDVFICYSSSDRKAALALVERLRADGISVWIDQGGIDAAAKWGKEIVRGITECKAVIVLLSRTAVDSHNVAKEISLASEEKKHILPIDLETVGLSEELRYPLAGIQHVGYKEYDAIVRSLTRLGIVPSADEKPLPSTALLSSPRKKYFIIAAVILLLVAGGYAIYSRYGAVQLSAQASPLKKIAVLPFDNFSSDKSDEYFADGLTEELIATLSKLKDIRVTSRTTVMDYKGKKENLRQIASELGVRYIVEGSVRKERDDLRITVQLINAETDEHLWSETYKGAMKDIFDFQEKVSEKIVQELSVSIDKNESASLLKRRTKNPLAYELYLNVIGKLDGGSSQNILQCISELEQVIKLDSGFVNGYTLMAILYDQLYEFHSQDEELLAKEEEVIHRALALDSSFPDTYLALGYLYRSKKDFRRAEEAVKKFIELDPQIIHGHYLLGNLYFRQHQNQAAARQFEKVVEMNPFSLVGWSFLISSYNLLGDNAKLESEGPRAVKLYENYLDKHHNNMLAQNLYGAILSSLKRYEEAAAQFEKSVKQDPNYRGGYLHLITLYGILKDKKRLHDAAARGFPLWERYLTNHPQDVDAKAEYLAMLGSVERYQDAEKEIEKNLKRKDINTDYLYEAGCIYARQGKASRACELLAKAIETGFVSYEHMKTDADLDPIRSDPKFRELMARLEQKVAKK